MSTQSRSMKMWQWILSTAIGGISAGATIVTLWGSLVYSSTQGKNLESRVDIIEVQGRQEISHIRDKIDDIYRILLERKRD